MSDLKNKRIITAALCGSWPTKDMNPAVPYTPEEIAEEAYNCWKAGAAIVHIHAREADGSPLRAANCTRILSAASAPTRTVTCASISPPPAAADVLETPWMKIPIWSVSRLL